MIELNYKKIGEGSPLIIMHGLFGSLDNWMTIAKTLSEKFEVFVLDARNHGQSSHSDEFDYEIMAQDLFEFIKRHQINQPIILGHSMGGKVAMQFAMNHPDMISKLIVVDIAPKPYPVHHQQIIDALMSLNFDCIKSRNDADFELSKHITDLSVRQFLLKNLFWKEKEKLAWRFNLEVISKKIDIVGKGLNNTQPFYKPTLFLRGEKSNYILDSDFDYINSIFKNSQIQTVENSGHWVHAENPTAFLQFLKSFLES